MADDLNGIKISELAETTDLAGLYTIGSDRNNQSKKVPLQFVKEAADYANVQGDYAKVVGDTIQGNTGVNQYSTFTPVIQYEIGSIVRYNNRLYRFTSVHPAGEWVGTDVVETSIKAENEFQIEQLSDEIIGQHKEFDYTSGVALNKFVFNVKNGDVVTVSTTQDAPSGVNLRVTQGMQIVQEEKIQTAVTKKEVVINYNGTLYLYITAANPTSLKVIIEGRSGEIEKIDSKLTELSAGVSQLIGTSYKTEYTKNNLIVGSYVGGVIQTFGYRTPVMSFKKGDKVLAEGFIGTPSYDFANEVKDGVFVRKLYAPSGAVSDFSFEISIEYDMDIVFSTSSNNFSITTFRNEAYSKIVENTEQIAKTDAKLNSSIGQIEVYDYPKEKLIIGAYVDNAVQTYGYRTSPIFFKKNDIAIVQGVSGTPSYAIAAQVNNNVFVKKIYSPSTVLDKDTIELTIEEDADIVFSTSSQSLNIIRKSGGFFATAADVSKASDDLKKEINTTLETKPSKSDLNFFGFTKDTYTSQYSFDRNLTLDAFELKEGSSFFVQMNAPLYVGYIDEVHIPTLNVNGTGFKNLYLNGVQFRSKYSWEKGDMLFVYYDGEAYQATGLFGQNKANAIWGDIQGCVYKNCLIDAEVSETGIANYKAYRFAAKKGDILYINTESTSNIDLICKVLSDGTIVKLEKGAAFYKGYRIGDYGYIYEVNEDATLQVTCATGNEPKILAINSYLTTFIVNAQAAIKEVANKATIDEVNKKASAADLAAESARREQDVNRLQQEIDNLDFSGDIEQVVKDYIAEHPESVTSIQDNSITEAKLTDSVRKKKASYYSNVAAMVADSTLEIGMTAITKGYYSENDGGAGEYTIISRQAENGGSYISLNNGLTASLNFDGKTYILSQWGVRGDGVARTARSVFSFLTTSAIKAVNSSFDDSVTDAAYMIQYLLNLSNFRNCEVVIDGREYKISHTIFLRSMVTLRGVEDGAPRSSWIDNLSVVGSYCKSSLIMQKAGVPMFASETYFGSSSTTIQLCSIKNLNARGTFGNKDIDGDAGSFVDSKNMVLTRCQFKNMNIAGFATAFKVVGMCLWTNFEGLHIFNMRDNGIDFVNNSEQKNANSINGCLIYSCGRDYDKSTGEYVNKYGATSSKANKLPIDKPTPSRGNCIVASYSGTYIGNCDLSDAAVGVYRSSYSDGTTIVGLYSEEISMAQIYNDYTEGNSNSAELGGYLRADQWTDSKGSIKQNKRIANPTDFVA